MVNVSIESVAMSEKVNMTCKEFVKIELIRRKDDDAQEYNEQTRYTQVRSAGTRAALYTMAVRLNGEAYSRLYCYTYI